MTDPRECWCNGTDIRIITDAEHQDVFVECHKCKLRTGYFESVQDAITAWNTRAYDAEMERLRAENQLYKDALERGELVRVVRCKNCRHHAPLNMCSCEKWECEGYWASVDDNDFCQHGEAALEKEGRG